jgi:phenylalanyl-tRNA synthetase beta chain
MPSRPKRRRATFARAAYAPPPLQAVTRDFAFLVPDAVWPQAISCARSGAADKANIVVARLFDRFAGPGRSRGAEVSLAVEVTLQPGEKSYTDPELHAISMSIISAAEKLGGMLRI